MLKKFLPNQHVKDIYEVTPAQLKKKGIKGVITDLDNTLVAWNEPDATTRVVNWFNEMAENEIKVIVISNNNEERVRIFSEPLDVPYIHSARKPLKRSFIRAAKQMSLKREEMVVIGDQIMTDVFGGNLAGFHTILVVPILKTDDKMTKLNRKMERKILDKLRKKGLVTWED